MINGIYVNSRIISRTDGIYTEWSKKSGTPVLILR